MTGSTKEGVVEVNFDGLVGPTHHYGGLSAGNIASSAHRWEISRPREAALQGLAKMDLLMRRGYPQALLPPQRRPVFEILRAAGFGGTEAEVVRDAWREAPGLLSACYSASAMWTANAATVTPAADAADGRTHFTPANLVSMFHRSVEPPLTGTVLEKIFGDPRLFALHPPLPPGRPFSDEGAANHTRLARDHGGPGLHLFVYGFSPWEAESAGRFPARQSLEASRAVARLHGIPSERVMFVRQSATAIDAGVFHNDVAAVGNLNLFLYHEDAFAEGATVAEELRGRFREIAGGELVVREVKRARVSLEEAVRTYLFNSQLLRKPNGGMLLLAPAECAGSDAVKGVVDEWLRDTGNPIEEVEYVDLRESMRNGGGPACLRLRIVLTPEERKAVRGRVMLDPALVADLEKWIRRHYRETLSPPDLADPRLAEECCRALDELGELLELGMGEGDGGRGKENRR